MVLLNQATIMENNQPDNFQPHNPEPSVSPVSVMQDDIPKSDVIMAQPTFTPPPAPVSNFVAPAVSHANSHFQPTAPIVPTVNAPTPSTLVAGQSVNPMPVVKVLSPRGVEYVFLSIALYFAAGGLISTLITFINGPVDFTSLSSSVSVLIVSLPIFSWLFLRLKKAELLDANLALDASKRRSTQLIQIIAFLTCFLTLIGFIAMIFSKLGGDYTSSILKLSLDVLVILLVAGGILFYYWRDEHKSR